LEIVGELKAGEKAPHLAGVDVIREPGKGVITSARTTHILKPGDEVR